MLSQLSAIYEDDNITTIQPSGGIKWLLSVDVRSAVDILGLNEDGTSNIFAQLQLVSSRNHKLVHTQFETEIVPCTNHPKYIHDTFVFGEDFDIRANIRSVTLIILVYHRPGYTRNSIRVEISPNDVCVGAVLIPLSSLPWTGKALDIWYDLIAPRSLDCGDEVTGKIRLKLLLQGPITTGSFSGKGDTVQIFMNEETHEMQVLDEDGNVDVEDHISDADEFDFVDEARLWLSETKFFKVYLFTSTSLSIIEAILVAFPLSDSNFVAQQVVLALSTSLFIAIVVALYSFIPHGTNIRGWRKLKRVMTIENIFELCTLIFGWILLYTYPGMAALRCLRLFRFLWFFEFIFSHEEDTALVWLLRNFAVGVDYFEKMYEDLLTKRTPGGAVVLGIYFYTIYVFAASIWIYTKDLESPKCHNLDTCMLFLFRLSLLDSQGWTYVDELFVKSRYSSLNILIVIFIIFTSLIILNSLKGLLGFVFMDTSIEEAQAETLVLDTIERRNRIKSNLADYEVVIADVLERRREIYKELRLALLQLKFERAALAVGKDTSSLLDIELAIESRGAVSEAQLKVLDDIILLTNLQKQNSVEPAVVQFSLDSFAHV